MSTEPRAPEGDNIVPLPLERNHRRNDQDRPHGQADILEFDRDRARCFALAAWMSQDKQPRLILTPDLSLIWLNEAAEAFSRSSGVFRLAAGRLVALHPSLQDRLARFDTGARAWIHVESPSGAEYLAWLRDIPTAVGRFLGLAVSANRRGCPSAFAVQYALSPAESRIVGALLEGKSPKEIANELVLTPSTVKCHISHAYAKIGVRTRGELFARASLYSE